MHLHSPKTQSIRSLANVDHKPTEDIICVASTEFQVLNLTELAAKKTKPYRYHLILIEDNSKSRQPKSYVKNNFGRLFTSINLVPSPQEKFNANPFHALAEVLSIRKKIRSIIKPLSKKRTQLWAGYSNELIIGSIYNLLKCQTVILVDDGVKSFLIAQDQNTNPNPKKKGPTTLKQKLFGSDQSFKNSGILFSAFASDSNSRNIKNDYSNLKKTSHPKCQNDICHIIGQPLPDLGLISTTNYILILKWIISKQNERQIIYIPHPLETTAIIDLIRNKAINNIKTLSEPYEFYLTRQSFYPKSIISFYSSALLVISQWETMLNPKLIYIDITDFLEGSKSMNVIKNAYALANSTHKIAIKTPTLGST